MKFWYIVIRTQAFPTRLQVYLSVRMFLPSLSLRKTMVKINIS